DLGQIDESRRALERALQCDPRHIDARWQLGELEVRSNHPEEALRWIAPLFEQWPEDSRLATTMAQALQQAGRTDEANKCWESVRKWQKSIDGLGMLIDRIHADPTNAELRYEVGLLLLRCQSREDGLAWLSSVLQFDPMHRKTHRALADYYSKIGQSEQAERHRRLPREELPAHRS